VEKLLLAATQLRPKWLPRLAFIFSGLQSDDFIALGFEFGIDTCMCPIFVCVFS
jgi:hypothetical protein